MQRKTVLITGANSGIGFETAKALAVQGYDLILIVRSQSKAAETVQQLLQVQPAAGVVTYIADLGNLEAVKNVAAEISRKHNIINCIICNAGYGPDKVEFNSNGLEQSFVTNYLGHFILVNKLIPQVEAAADGRIINVASSAYKMGKVSRMFVKNIEGSNALKAYGDGKLANVLFTKALAKKLKNATTFSLHPGVVNSGFGANYTGFFKFMAGLMRPFMITPEKGAETSIYLATAPLKDIEQQNGNYFEKSKPVAIKSAEVSDANAAWLWEKSMEAVGL